MCSSYPLIIGEDTILDVLQQVKRLWNLSIADISSMWYVLDNRGALF